ncbi:hypothetical protein QTP86_030862, partial [Hemibagrus guttatus]
KSASQSRDKTYVFLWTSRQFQQEQTEWDAVNRLLQHQGFKPVRFTDPTENKNLADLVLLERTSSSELRITLKTMLMDSERRQALIQELIQSNSKLKQEVEQQQARAVRQSHRAEELEGVLAGVKVKVQGLEDSIINKAAQQQGQLQRLQQDKRDAQMLCQALQQQLSEQESQVCELQKKLQLAVKEEEKRASCQNQAFQQFLSRSPRHSPSDQLILDVISVYESQLQQLQDKLKKCRRCSVCKNDSSDSQNTDTSELTSSSYKTLLKSYQEQLKKTKAQREDLKLEVQRLRQELDSRPSVKELKSFKQQLRRMERLVQHNNNGSSVQTETNEDPPSSSSETQRRVTESQRYIMEICSELKVKDVNHVVAAVKARCREADSALRLEKILSDITAILTDPRAPLALLRRPDGPAGSDVEQIVPVLKMWSRQLGALPDLQHSVSRLVRRLLPWQPEDEAHPQSKCVKVEDVMLMVDTMLDQTAPDDKMLRTPTKPTLQAMVSHFQMLFDVASIRGVYPRMNEVYTRLAEMNNAMRNLRDILDMDESASPGNVVNVVARIMTGTLSSQNQHKLLGTSDLDREDLVCFS